MKHLNITITGKVQGVGFRETTKIVANQMMVQGYVRNEKDGTVFIEAEGDEIFLEEFVRWCNEGPDRSRVENVMVSEGEVKNYRNFEILRK
ncbi:acylphosphatase [Pedobacter frigidisoli]|uniref:Acylphosphatase n=1 Tax=Pedobacter frigidisoli TaxID=2530455 RepID=A0A4R0P253_9SPHI|nr:acylphosphatase [Pedobacter frigidisoli]TCD10892.1 acylphosphatase [Pedobacter frigidisoli]